MIYQRDGHDRHAFALGHTQTDRHTDRHMFQSLFPCSMPLHCCYYPRRTSGYCISDYRLLTFPGLPASRRHPSSPRSRQLSRLCCDCSPARLSLSAALCTQWSVPGARRARLCLLFVCVRGVLCTFHPREFALGSARRHCLADAMFEPTPCALDDCQTVFHY